MEARPRTTVEYVSRNGKNHFADWLDHLDIRANAAVIARLIRVRNGTFGDTKPVGEGVTELRIDYGPGLRVYYGSDGPELVILFAGGDKSTQDRDIALAKKLWKEYKLARTHANR